MKTIIIKLDTYIIIIRFIEEEIKKIKKMI